MAKRDIGTLVIPERDEILTKMDELETLVASYFLKFNKTTTGQRSIGEASLEFVKKCDEKADLYPEVLSANFNTADFKNKLNGVKDFFDFKQRMMDTLNKWDTSAKICKTDAMYYANKFYGIIQVDSKDNVKYKPTLDELTGFYKKSTAEKTPERKLEKDAVVASN